VANGDGRRGTPSRRERSCASFCWSSALAFISLMCCATAATVAHTCITHTHTHWTPHRHHRHRIISRAAARPPPRDSERRQGEGQRGGFLPLRAACVRGKSGG
jgi:hypothetical protein